MLTLSRNRLIIISEREVREMKEIRYRLIFKDGSHSAWSTDKEWVVENAKFFRADIEVWEVELP